MEEEEDCRDRFVAVNSLLLLLYAVVVVCIDNKCCVHSYVGRVFVFF